MPTQAQIIAKIIDTIAKATDKFHAQVPGIQKAMLDEVELLMKDLVVKGRSLATTAENLKTVSKIKGKLEAITRSPEYLAAIKEFTNAFQVVADLQTQYFDGMVDKFKPPALVGELLKQSIENTINNLTAGGITATITPKIQEILRNNISTGTSYSAAVTQVRDFMSTSDTGVGVLERYAKQITTDALNQFSANYTAAVTDDLGLVWFQYTGALIETSRIFCEALKKKKFVHKSELPAIVRGDFPEFKEMKGTLNDKTKLPEGMYAGTNATNFFTYRGGYNCNHQLIPVPTFVVPKELRAKFEEV